MGRLTLITSVGLVCVVIAAVTGQLRGEDSQGIEAISRPSDDRMLAFVRSGLVAKIHVADGDWVKAGQLLIQLDDAAEQMQIEQLRAEAEDQTQIEAAVAQRDQSQVDLQRKKQALLLGAATDLEVQHARLEALIQELRLKLAKFQQKQAGRKLREVEALVDRMRIVSPIEGRIEGIDIEEGEAAQEQGKIIRVIQVDPLWIDVPVPLNQAGKLKEGAVACVTFGQEEGDREQIDGRIKLVRSEADAASDTLNVRVEVSNPSHRPAGEHVRVTFTPLAKQTNAKKTE